MTHPFRFGLQAFEATTAAEWLDLVKKTEDLGYSTLFSSDHYFGPGRISEATGHRPVDMAPLVSIAVAAAATSHLRVGCRVFACDFHHPVVLAKETATLDLLSGGRARVGLGQAWSADELEAVGADPKARASRADEFMAVLKAMWGPDPVGFQGRHFRVARSIVGLKPVQRPHPPIYLAGYVAPALRRAASVADGWLPANVPVAGMAQMVPQLHALARQAGRDPGRFEIIYMTPAQVTSAPLDDAKRGTLCGSAAQVRGDVGRLADLGVTEIIGWSGGQTVDDMLAILERFRETVG